MRRVKSNPTAALSSQHAYFQRIETAFIRLRGAPLLLSPKDWKIITAWHEAGIPLELVLGCLRDVFATRAERGTSSKVNSISYCVPAVEKAWAEARELQLFAPDRSSPTAAPAPEALEVPPEVPSAVPSEVPSGVPGDSVGGVAEPMPERERQDQGGQDPGEGAGLQKRLRSLAEALPAELREVLPDLESWRSRVLACGQAASGSAAEDALCEVEKALLREVHAKLDGATRREIEEEVEAATRGLREQVGDADLERARGSVRRQVMRRRLGLPRLSLFPAVY